MFILDLVKKLNSEEVPYALVGGYALAFHNIIRATMDIDLVVSFNLKDLEKCEALLKKLGLQSRIPVSAKEISKFHKEYVTEKNLIAWSFVDYKNPHRVVDILLIYNIKDIETETFKTAGEKVRVASLKSLLKMKKLANRPQDQNDIQIIEAKINEKK
ncbi:MAG: nucleotidyl transferase AbiEii/AbiGii toxin family protein [Bdellovibrionota bacterium]